MTLHRFVDPIDGHVAESKLKGVVPIVLHRLLLNHDAGAGFNNGYRDNVALLIEDLGHADFFADDAFLHVYTSLVTPFPRRPLATPLRRGRSRLSETGEHDLAGKSANRVTV